MDNCPHCGGQLGKAHDFIGPEIPADYVAWGTFGAYPNIHPFKIEGYTRRARNWNPMILGMRDVSAPTNNNLGGGSFDKWWYDNNLG